MYDLETTGLTNDDHVIEIGAIYVSNGKILDSFSALCNPGYFINQRIVEITGITNGMLKDADSEKSVVTDFVNWCDSKNTDICVGHNINKFDNRMMKVATRRFGLQFPFKRTLDTLIMAQRANLKSRGCTSNKQESIAEFYGFTYEAHRAVNDVEALFKIFQYLEKEVSQLPIIKVQ